MRQHVGTSTSDEGSSAQEPYINHLLEVASLVAEATHGKDPDLVIAALLHDAIEDQEVPRELIEREFGKRVAEVVSQVTDDKTLPKENRGLRGIEWVIFEGESARKAGIAEGFCISRDGIFGMNSGWHEHRDASGGYGIRIRLQAFARSRRCAEFSVIRRRA